MNWTEDEDEDERRRLPFGGSVIVSERDGGNIIAFQLALPPCAGFSAGGEIGEMIVVKDGANVTGRGVGERVAFEQRQDFWRALQKTDAEIDEPWVAPVIAEGGEPHLPIQSRLMWGDEFRSAFEIAGFVLEFVFEPCDAVVAAFDNNLGAGCSHHS